MKAAFQRAFGKCTVSVLGNGVALIPKDVFLHVLHIHCTNA